MLGRDDHVRVRIMASAPHTEPAEDCKDKVGKGWMSLSSLREKIGPGMVISQPVARTHQSVKGLAEVTGHRRTV